MTFEGLAENVLDLLAKGIGEPCPDTSFNDLALAVFRFQCQWNEAYGRFVRRRGVDPERCGRWEEIPFLPTRAFKAAPLVSGDIKKVTRVFRTSGTTMGEGNRGEHHVLDLSLYRASLLPNFKTHLLREGEEGIRILCLLPDPDVARDSSLSFMMGEVVRTLGGEGSGFSIGTDGGIDGEGFWLSLQEACEEGNPVIVAGTAFGFVKWWGMAVDRGWEVGLPEGSRIMETGGYKGRSKELSRDDLYRALHNLFGVPASRVVNEYGMTELLSQFYEPVLASVPGVGDSGRSATAEDLSVRYHRGPPWTRTRILDPLTLAPVPAGEPGVIAHLDLANLGSVSGVLTEDLGRELPHGFQLLGRSPGSEPRGCSLAMEDFLASRETRS